MATIAHPCYATAYATRENTAYATREHLLLLNLEARLGDEVSLAGGSLTPLGTVTDIHGESFGDGPGDTITVIPAAVTLSSGDRYPVADLVLLRRAEQ